MPDIHHSISISASSDVIGALVSTPEGEASCSVSRMRPRAGNRGRCSGKTRSRTDRRVAMPHNEWSRRAMGLCDRGAAARGSFARVSRTIT